MPAKNLKRVEGSGVYSHIFNQGVENRSIFVDDSDYQTFLNYLEEYLSTPKDLEQTKQNFTVNGRVFKGIPHQPKNYFGKVELLAYNLQPNHFHLILHQKTEKSLQAFIRSLCTRYSMYFNKKYSRSGSLFDGPYKSSTIKDNPTLLLLSQYLHKSGNYTSYPQYRGQKDISWLNTKDVLSIKNIEGNYVKYVDSYVPSDKEEELLRNIIIENPKAHLERRDPEVSTPKQSSRFPELVAASAVFILLIGLGLRNISTSAYAIPDIIEPSPNALGVTTVLPSPSPSPSPTISPTPVSMLKIRKSDTSTPVNIQSQPKMRI